LLNALRAGFADFGIIAAQGFKESTEILALDKTSDKRLAEIVRVSYRMLADSIVVVEERIKSFARHIMANTKFDDTCKHFSTIPSIGPVTSTTVVALVGDAARFDTVRDFAAWIGLVHRQNSSGGKSRFGRITKAGDQSHGLASRCRCHHAVLELGCPCLGRLRTVEEGTQA
jgi:transposase